MHPDTEKGIQEIKNEQILGEIDELRAEVSGCLGFVHDIASRIARGTGGREVSLAITKLQEAQSWLRLAQDEMKPAPIAEANREESYHAL